MHPRNKPLRLTSNLRMTFAAACVIIQIIDRYERDGDTMSEEYYIEVETANMLRGKGLYYDRT